MLPLPPPTLDSPPTDLRGARLCAALLASFALWNTSAGVAALPQEGPPRGLTNVDPRWHALVHARAVLRPGVVVDDATIVVRDGWIVSVEAGAAPPDGARVHDCTGLSVYPGLVEAHLSVPAPIPAPETATDHWHHTLVTPQRSALDGAGVPPERAEALRKLGFCAAAIAPEVGIFRGRAAVVALGAAGDDLQRGNIEVLAEDVLQVMAFERAGFSAEGDLAYPSSEMGAIALARQTLSDADHYARASAAHAAGADVLPPPPSRALEALTRDLPLLFDARTELQALRAAKLAREYDRALIVLGSGQEYRRLEALRAARVPVLAPLDFPEAPDVSTHAKAEGLALRDLLAWEQAPSNARRLHAAGVPVALTTARLGDVAELPERVRRVLADGLDDDTVLAMWTTVPATLLGLGERLGRVEPGCIANLVVTDGALFAEDTVVRDVYVLGRRHVIAAAPLPALGEWDAVFDELGGARDVAVRLAFGEGDSLTLTRATASDAEGASKPKAVKARKVTRGRYHVHFHLAADELADAAPLAGEGAAAGPDTADVAALSACSGLFEGDAVLHGSIVGADGVPRRWRATRVPAPPKDAAAPPAAEGASSAPEAEAPLEASPAPDLPGLPFGAYALEAPPTPEDVRVEGATLWTSGPLGIVPDGVLVVTAGRIVYAGPAAEAPATPGHRVLDARGRHVTPGLIDCHSHTGISGGVNEGGQRVTCEVRIADVLDPDAIAFYHQLAGGLTAANLLHGSANAIGGQNAVIKLRWGAVHPDDLLLQGAPGGVKFALGENPKRVAAQSERPGEYPATRLGVEALLRDRLNAGRQYAAERARYAALSPWEQRRTAPPRRDFELEALAEIARGERWIHCHSYRQDEILMLARMAQEFGIQIGTFQHVLEGYKVAEVIKDVARGASSFADWWAYKFEVIDAIPDSPAIMHAVGVNVSINSDSDEFARRLNTEAAKGVKYGGMSPHDALCMVTINPAYQLGVHERVGSLEPGKDADFVLWSGDPLRYASRCEATWIDGAEVYSLARDAAHRERAERERQRVVQRLMTAGPRERRGGDDGARGGSGRRPGALARGELTLREAYRLGLYDEIEALWRSGIDPSTAQPGVCGCWDVLLGGEELWQELIQTEGGR